MDSFQSSHVKKLVFEEKSKKMQEIKDSRLKLLILQILENPDDKRKVKMSISMYKAHIADFDKMEENNVLQERLKQEKNALKRVREVQEEVTARVPTDSVDRPPTIPSDNATPEVSSQRDIDHKINRLLMKKLVQPCDPGLQYKVCFCCASIS